MRLKRLQIEEGFLRDLDIEFRDGLNVLIGPRGAGKTSVIEILRLCLGAPALTDRTSKQVRQHALSILGSGQATLTVDVDGDEATIVRTADDAGQAPTWAKGVVVLSQSEIELVAVEEAGRRALIDSFISQDQVEARGRVTASLRALTTEAKDLLDEIEQLKVQLQDRADAEARLAGAELEQREVMQAVAATQADQQDLEGLQRALAASSTRKALYDRAQAALASWGSQVTRVAGTAPIVEDWPAAAGGRDRLAEVRGIVEASAASLRNTASEIEDAIEIVISIDALEQQDRRVASDATRVIRQRLEDMRAGAGAVAKRVTDLRELAGQASALRALIVEREERLLQVKTARKRTFVELERLRQDRSQRREAVAAHLEDNLGPRLRVQIGASEALDSYVAAIAGALRGSGLQYAALAELLADVINPLELTELVEHGNPQDLASAAGITVDRAAKAIDVMRTAGTETIVSAEIDDSVELSMQLSPKDWKPSEQLSTGQRCTVILPIVLSRRSHPVIVDQPEDNLDNAYVAETVVAALRSRQTGDQFIFATHNPNIPVLGDADQVVVLASDGVRGTVTSAAPLLDPKSIDAIASIMEGGREAFATRAKLYRSS